jgi:molecular chaperone DnaK (HSP70)
LEQFCVARNNTSKGVKSDEVVAIYATIQCGILLGDVKGPLLVGIARLVTMFSFLILSSGEGAATVFRQG